MESRQDPSRATACLQAVPERAVRLDSSTGASVNHDFRLQTACKQAVARLREDRSAAPSERDVGARSKPLIKLAVVWAHLSLF